MSNAVLIIEDEAVLAKKIRKYLELRGYATQAATDGTGGIEAFEAFHPDIVLLDFNLPGERDGLAVLAHLRKLDPRVKVVLITGHGNVKLAVEAMKSGAYDYLSKPIVLSELELLIDKAVHEDRIDAQLSYYRNKKSAKGHIERILGGSPSVVRLRDTIRQIISAERNQAEGDPPAVLITGETGTGKELVARALHFDGLRADRPLIQINAATLPRDLLESELFGYERGAFTGARERKLGLVEAAEGGTLFLDEIGELDLSMQAKLLRLVEDRKIRRLGGARDRRVNIRLITATNRSLETMVQDGSFRADLFYRLRIFSVVTPPLRERAGDIPCLADLFLIGLGKRYNRRNLRLSDIDMSVLARWTIQPRLLGVPGVANVAIWGQRKRQLQVQVDPERLKAKGVTLNQVIRTAGEALWVSPLTFLKASTPGSGGWIDTPNQRLGVRHLQPIATAAELARVAVDGKALVLNDIATVVENHPLLIGDAVINDGPGLMLVVEKFPWANTLEVTRGLEKTLDAIRPGLSGLEIDSTLFRPATYIESSLDNLAWTLPIGGALAIAVLLLFFYNWRTALISVIAILTSLVAAGLVLYLRGAAVDTMVLTGLVVALGVIIDDAIVDIQNIARRLSHRRKDDADKPVARIIVEASFEMRSIMAYATLILLLVVAPLFFIESLSGAFLKPLALSYGLALLASMVVALTVTPALSVLLLSGKPLDEAKFPFAGALSGAYETAASWIMRRPSMAYLAAGVLLCRHRGLVPARAAIAHSDIQGI